MAKIKNIPCDIFKRDIDVFIGSYEELCKYAKKHLKKDPLLDEITDNTPDYAACFYFRADGTGAERDQNQGAGRICREVSRAVC